MAEKKKQHYVPKLYMKNFADIKKNVSVFNIKTKTIISNIPYDSQCFKDYFYGKDHVLEDEISKKETLWENVLTKVIQGKQLSDYDISQIKQFALYQRQRTAGETEYHRAERKEFLIKLARDFYVKNGIYFGEETEKLCEEYAKEKVSPVEIVALAESLLNIINDLELLIITYRTNNKLIFSDVPIISINQFHKFSIGYSCVGLILMFPVSPNKLIVLYDSKMYPKYSGRQYIELTNESEVKLLNIFQFISAEKTLYAHDSKDFPDFTNENWKQRSLNRDSKKIQSLGAPGNEIIRFSMRQTFFDCTLSFGKLSEKAKRIPFVCKEAFPRKYDKSWHEKLKSKIGVISLMAEKRPDVFKGLTKKEIRKGCKNLLDFAEAYWREE
jgi:hypothetical protein